MEQLNLDYWLNNYVNKLTPTDEIIKYINSYKFTNNIDVKIEEIEINFTTKLQEIQAAFENDNIEHIYGKKPSLDIIQKEVEIIKLISKYSLQNNKLEYTFVLNCLNYLLQLSEMLRIRIKQSAITFTKPQKNSGIVRCSYKFCNYKENCTYNYGKKGCACYQDHYVHNMVSHDVQSLIAYIEMNHSDGDTIMHNKEILKTINTLAFVIGHMECELKAKCLYNDMKDWEKYHFVNSKNT